MYKKSFSLENRKENVLASVHFNRFENVTNNFIPIFGNQLWTVALGNQGKLGRCTSSLSLFKIEYKIRKF